MALSLWSCKYSKVNVLSRVPSIALSCVPFLAHRPPSLSGVFATLQTLIASLCHHHYVLLGRQAFELGLSVQRYPGKSYLNMWGSPHWLDQWIFVSGLKLSKWLPPWLD